MKMRAEKQKYRNEIDKIVNKRHSDDNSVMEKTKKTKKTMKAAATVETTKSPKWRKRGQKHSTVKLLKK